MNIKTAEEVFLKIFNNQNCFIDYDKAGFECITLAMKEYALEIASDAYDEGFTYGIGSHKDFKQTGMNKFEYSQKLHNEL